MKHIPNTGKELWEQMLEPDKLPPVIAHCLWPFLALPVLILWAIGAGLFFGSIHLFLAVVWVFNLVRIVFNEVVTLIKESVT